MKKLDQKTIDAFNNSQNLSAVYGSLRQNQYNAAGLNNNFIMTELSFDGYAMHSLTAYPYIYPKEQSKIVIDILNLDDRQDRSIVRMEEGAGYITHLVELREILSQNEIDPEGISEEVLSKKVKYYVYNPAYVMDHREDVPEGDWRKFQQNRRSSAGSYA